MSISIQHGWLDTVTVYEAKKGIMFYTTATECVAYARSTGDTVLLEFNTIYLRVTPEMTVNEVCDAYDKFQRGGD